MPYPTRYQIPNHTKTRHYGSKSNLLTVTHFPGWVGSEARIADTYVVSFCVLTATVHTYILLHALVVLTFVDICRDMEAKLNTCRSYQNFSTTSVRKMALRRMMWEINCFVLHVIIRNSHGPKVCLSTSSADKSPWKLCIVRSQYKRNPIWTGFGTGVSGCSEDPKSLTGSLCSFSFFQH